MNPCAGQRHASRALGAVIGILQAGGYRCTVLLTEKPGDGKTLAYQYGGDYDSVVAIGGDGTLNEVPVDAVPCADEVGAVDEAGVFAQAANANTITNANARQSNCLTVCFIE